MKIEYNGEMVEAYDLVISRKIAEQIIKGERTLVTYWASLYYQNKFIDNEQEEINQKLEQEGRNDEIYFPSKNIWFAHFKSFGASSFDARISNIGVAFLIKDDIEDLSNEFNFHDFDNMWQQYTEDEGRAPGFFYLSLDDIIRQSDDNERVWKKRSRY